MGEWYSSCSLHPSCIVIAKLANPAHKYTVPRFKQRIEVRGASCSILRQQFPLQLVYGVTVHRVQGCTVQKVVQYKGIDTIIKVGGLEDNGARRARKIFALFYPEP